MTTSPGPITALARVSLLALICATPVLARDEIDPGPQPIGRIIDTETTGSLPVAPGDRQIAAPVEAVPIAEIIARYRKRDTASADQLAIHVHDRDSRALLEWIAIKSGGPSIRHARIAAFIDTHPDWPGLPSLRRRAEETLLEERARPEVIRQFFLTRQPLSAAGKIALARVLVHDGQTEDAVALVRKTWRQEHMGAPLETIVAGEFAAHLTRADHRSRTERYIFRGNRDAAYRNARRIGADYVKLAEARFASATKAGASQKLIDAVPASLRDDISFAFLRAQSFRRQNKPVEAAAAIAHVPRDRDLLGDGDEWWVERRLIARKLLDIGERETAYRVVANHMAATPQHIIEAEWHAGWIALRFLNDPARASSHFATAASVAETPISIARAAYWQGRAAEALGQPTEADAYFTSAAQQSATYYGQMARAKLGESHTPVRRAAMANLADIRGAAGARLLYTNPETRALGTSLLLDLARHLVSTPELEAVAAIAHQGRNAQTLLSFGKIALQRGFPLDTAAFPTQGVPGFEAIGEPVERAVVHAIARQESAFDPQAVSHAGARGLMQMMPATARETARRTKSPYDVRLLTADAAYCARLGAAHLGDLMQEWRSSHALVFAAYNAGSGNVRNWIAAYGDPRDPSTDLIDWVERIPFSETRNYVQRVSENLAVYRTLLNEQVAMSPPSGLIPAALRD